MIFLERQLAAELDQVVAVELDVRQAEVIAEGQALLLDLLEIGSAADLDERIDEAEAGRVGRPEHQVGFQIIDACDVEEAVAAEAILELGGVDVILDVDPAIERRLPAEITNVLFLADAARQFEAVIVGRLEGELAEAEMLAERRDETAGEDGRIEADQADLAGRHRAGDDVAGIVLNIGFVIDEEKQFVANDRAAERGAILVALELALRLIVPLLEEVLLDQILVREQSERLAVKFVGAGLGDGGDDRRPGILIFRLEVGGQDAEFADRELRKGIAGADVLADRRRPG